MRIQVHIDGFMEPRGAAELVSRVLTGDYTVEHYLCLSCNDLFEVPEGTSVVHDCDPSPRPDEKSPLH